MIHRHARLAGSLLAGTILFQGFPQAAASAPTVIRGAGTVTVTTYATGFNNPRNVRFGPDGNLYVAEGGPGGANSTEGQCEQVPGAPDGPGPYTGSPTGGRISKVVNGTRVTVTDQFPSSQPSPNVGSTPSGVADIGWVGGTLYALTAGSGCSHGVPNTSNGIFRVGSNGSITEIANLSAFQMAHPVAHPNADDFEPDGTWYSMVVRNGAFYAVEPNHGELDKITTGGSISRVVDISATQGHIVPTAIASHGVFYVGNLHPFPIEPGSSKILQITPAGQIHTAATGFTTVLGLTFDNIGRMYVLENTTVAGEPTPGTGDIVRVGPGGKRQVIVSGLNLPGGLTFGPDGALYVSVWSFGPPPSLPEGPGMVLRIRLDN
jgi:hypothetical protein